MTPKETLKKTDEYAENLKRAKKLSVAVGLPSEKVGGKIYDNGLSVIEVGSFHEFGEGVPQRSFLRVPFSVKADEISDFIRGQFIDVYEGTPADKALGLIGLKAQQVSQDAFSTNGYGTWEGLSKRTVKIKGSSKPLFDKGTLKASITYIVRGGE